MKIIIQRNIKYNIYFFINHLQFSKEDYIWINGGLGQFNYEKQTHLIPSEYNLFWQSINGPVIPEPRILHCSLNVNKTHSFIHGGKVATFPDMKYDQFYIARGDIVKHRYNGYASWNYTWIENKTAENSYLYDWKKNYWIKVLLKRT